MKRVLLVSFGSGVLFAMVGFFVPIWFARDQGLVFLAILTGPFGFIVGFALGFVWEARRLNLLSPRKIISLLYTTWLLMALYYLYFVTGTNKEIIFGTTFVQTLVVAAIFGILALEKSIQKLPLATKSGQKTTAIATIIMTAMQYFPPYKQNSLARSTREIEGGYVFLLDQNLDASTRIANYQVDTERLMFQWLLVFAIACLYYFFAFGRSR
jgi:hypothetical protein